MFFRASLFGAFGESKRWLATNADGSSRPLRTSDFYKAGAITGFIAAFTEGPIDFYKSQIQVQIIRAKCDPAYKPPYTTVGGCVSATIRTNGLRGPFQVCACVLLVVAMCALGGCFTTVALCACAAQKYSASCMLYSSLSASLVREGISPLAPICHMPHLPSRGPACAPPPLSTGSGRNYPAQHTSQRCVPGHV